MKDDWFEISLKSTIIHSTPTKLGRVLPIFQLIEIEDNEWFDGEKEPKEKERRTIDPFRNLTQLLSHSLRRDIWRWWSSNFWVRVRFVSNIITLLNYNYFYLYKRSCRDRVATWRKLIIWRLISCFVVLIAFPRLAEFTGRVRSVLCRHRRGSSFDNQGTGTGRKGCRKE